MGGAVVQDEGEGVAVADQQQRGSGEFLFLVLYLLDFWVELVCDGVEVGNQGVKAVGGERVLLPSMEGVPGVPAPMLLYQVPIHEQVTEIPTHDHLSILPHAPQHL